MQLENAIPSFKKDGKVAAWFTLNMILLTVTANQKIFVVMWSRILDK